MVKYDNIEIKYDTLKFFLPYCIATTSNLVQEI